MIGDILTFLKTDLNAYLKMNEDHPKDVVEFLKEQTAESLTFSQGAVTMLLINLEEEHLLRSANRYQQVQPNGQQRRINPEVRLNLFVLFVMKFKAYDTSLQFLSRVVSYFQQRPVIDKQNSPTLNDNIGQLVTELVTMPFAQQNEVWSSLRTVYHPSVLYKIKMARIQDAESVLLPTVEQTVVKVTR